MHQTKIEIIDFMNKFYFGHKGRYSVQISNVEYTILFNKVI